tara:strand:+ start:660 stop:1415 length:756 start_codon:yes stop_codon:yes gene_type:complete
MTVSAASFTGPIDSVEATTDGLLTQTTNACDIGGTFKGSFPDLPDISGFADGIEDSIGELTKKAAELTKSIKGAFEDAVGDIQQFTDFINTKFTEYTTAINAAVVGPIQTALIAARDAFQASVDALIANITSLIGDANTILSDAAAEIGEQATALLGSLGKLASAIKLPGCGVASSAVSAIGPGASSLIDSASAGDAVSGLAGGSISALSGAADGAALSLAAGNDIDSAALNTGIQTQLGGITTLVNNEVV